MNAHELAEIVDKWAYSESAEYLTDAANMLRQQADRIAELEKQGSSIWDSTRRVYKNCQCDSCKNKTSPQTKPLSDEEIKELIVNKVTDYELCRAIEERHGIK